MEGESDREEITGIAAWVVDEGYDGKGLKDSRGGGGGIAESVGGRRLCCPA